MKKLLITLLFGGFLLGFSNFTYAQEDYSGLNVFVKFGDESAASAHYEIPIAKNFTISPAVAFSFDFDYIAIGGRADYYFDSLLNINEPWDIWAGVDTGFVIGNEKDDVKDYYDDFELNLHAGVEYKFNETWGIIAEIGGGGNFGVFGTFGVGIHF
ncbi:MAG: hypothetical protein ABFR05_09410 [Bacteroidota bacterium]